MANRRSLDVRLELALADAQRSGEGFAVIMMDVNGFKSVNDVLGHRAGDQLKETIRDVDYAGRLGGDEFLVIARGRHEDVRSETSQCTGHVTGVDVVVTWQNNKNTDAEFL